MTFHNIKLYPYESDEDDEHDRALNESIQDLIPFAVVGSEKTIVVDGKPVRGRQNRWGVINGKDRLDKAVLCILSKTVMPSLPMKVN
jgi:septin 3/9/12